MEWSSDNPLSALCPMIPPAISRYMVNYNAWYTSSEVQRYHALWNPIVTCIGQLPSENAYISQLYSKVCMAITSWRSLPFKVLVMYPMAARRKLLPFEALQVGIWRLSAVDPHISKPYRYVHKAASMKCIHFESLEVDTSIWSLPADDSYLSKIYRHVHKSDSRKCIHFESLQLGTSISSLQANNSYLSTPYNHVHKSASRKCIPFKALYLGKRWLPSMVHSFRNLLILNLANSVSIW